MKLQNDNLQKDKKYDLEERCSKFAEDVIDFLRKLPNTPINRPLVEQCSASSGSMEQITVRLMKERAGKILCIK